MYEPTRYCAAGDHMVYFTDFYERDKTCRVCRKAQRMTHWNTTPEHRARMAPSMCFHSMIADARRRAAKKGLDYDLDGHKAVLRDRLSRGLCEMTSLPLVLERGKRGAFSPSLHRIEPELGYRYSNVAIIAFGVNALIGSWGPQDARMIAQAFINNGKD